MTANAGPQVGGEFAGYSIEARLGRGGMSTVFLARHQRLGRRVALKIPTAELLDDQAYRTRFVRESQLAAAIDHPHIIPIYEAGEVDGVPFIAMRYVEGTDLKGLLAQEGRLDPRRAIVIVEQVASALDAAHAGGLIHRDVKPANVLVVRRREGSGQDHAYLCDFGLTKHSSSQTGLTGTGQFLGTLDYVAPEQIQGAEVDARTDLYSLGCVLFECLTGSAPFIKDNQIALVYSHLQELPPPASTRVPGLPPAIDTVIARAMAKSPVDRFGSGEEFVAAVREALLGGRDAAPAATQTAARPPEVATAAPARKTQVVRVRKPPRAPMLRPRLARIAAALAPPRWARRLRAHAAATGIAAAVIAAGVAGLVFLAARPAAGPASSTGSVTESGGTVPASPDAAAGIAPASSDADGATRVVEALFPHTSPGFTATACAPSQTAGWSACPVTDRLAQRLGARPLGSGVDPVCRCPAGYSDVTGLQVTPTDAGAVVHLTLVFSDGSQSKLDITVAHRPWGWLADDTACSVGGASTSIYADNPPSCGI